MDRRRGEEGGGVGGLGVEKDKTDETQQVGKIIERVQGLGFGVWGSGFGVWDVGVGG